MSHEGIQARRRLVAEHQWRIGQYLRSEGQPLHLASRKTLHSARYPNHSVSAFRKSELILKETAKIVIYIHANGKKLIEPEWFNGKQLASE